MGYWNTRGLRGSGLEELINMTNEIYRQRGLAVIQKIPTPITPVEIQKETGRISLAYFDSKSTVDYIGVVQGIPICFDAKETTQKSLPIQNIHEHQIKFMKDFSKQDGISFIIVYFRIFDKYYFLPFSVLESFWNSSKTGGRKSIPFDAFETTYEIKYGGACPLHYLEQVAKIINNKFLKTQEE